MQRLARLAFIALILLALVLIPAASLGQPRAGDCQIGPDFASTLFIPYFEVDLDGPGGVTTLISVNNGLASEVLTRVVLWTDWGVPTLAFDVYLVGFDVQTINLRSVFNGVVPSTGEGADLSAFPFCGGLPPFHANPILSVDEQNQLAADHQGFAGPLASDCAGAFYGDGIARGYITIDTVDECSGVEGFGPVFTPANTSYPYFADGDASGIGVNRNQLWGDYIYVDFNEDSAQGSEAIALWSDATQFGAGRQFTFYGRFSDWDGRDNRVPLPEWWNQRFLNGGPFAGGADLIVYHDPMSPPDSPLCGDTPAWWPIASQAASIDESADNVITLGNGFFPNVTQRVAVSDLAIPYDFGWIQITQENHQTWVQPTLAAGGRFSAAFNGTPVTFLCDQTPPMMP